jgi:hypothetical protein
METKWGRRSLAITALQMRRLACLGLVILICASAQTPQTIQLTVDYSDGVRKEFVLPFKPGMTVFNAMTAAKASPHGLTFGCDPKFGGTSCSGSPASLLLSYIDDVKNQGAGASAKNWLFWVDDTFSDQGFGVCKIGQGDKVLWKFDIFKNEKQGKACR